MRKLSFLIFMVLMSGCAHQHFVFEDAPAVKKLNDKTATAVPSSDDFNIRQYLISSSVRSPIVNSFDLRRVERSQDVNAMDDVPESSWFTPRLGYREITPDELLKGPENIGPPQKPLTVLKKKTKGSAAGFVVRDARGHKYLIKFDSIEYPGFESMVNFVANRIFWGLGYNVPEDYLYYFKRGDLKVAKKSKVTEDDIEEVLMAVLPDSDERYRSTASLYIQGNVLGHIAQKGTRKGNPHDQIKHENLRILRALYVYCSLLHHTGMRSDNTLEVYKGEEGKGYTEHYILDFGEAFGIHGLNYSRLWEGSEHFFSFQEIGKNALNLGYPLKAWEKLDGSESDVKLYYNSEAFDPGNWKETFQFMPIRRSQADDDYWALKIISALSDAHLAKLFKAADSPEDGYAEYLQRTFVERRRMMFEHLVAQVSPLESSGVKKGQLLLEDLGVKWLPSMEDVSYKVRFYNRGHKTIGSSLMLTPNKKNFKVPISSEDLKAAKGYLRIEVLSVRDGVASKRPAEFHIRAGNNNQPKLVGIVH